MKMIRVMIVDDLPKIAEYFQSIINKAEDMQVVGVASTGAEAALLAAKLKPDIILMDIQMETDLAGIYAIEAIKNDNPDIKIIVLTIHEEDTIIFKSYIAGAVDFLTKTSSVNEIVEAIRNITNSTFSMKPEIAEKLVAELVKMKNEHESMLYMINIMTKLTTSEFEVLKSICDGDTYRQIAKKRFVEEVTIRSQVNKILKKFEKKSVSEVVRIVNKLNIFEVYKKINK